MRDIASIFLFAKMITPTSVSLLIKFILSEKYTCSYNLLHKMSLLFPSIYSYSTALFISSKLVYLINSVQRLQCENKLSATWVFSHMPLLLPLNPFLDSTYCLKLMYIFFETLFLSIKMRQKCNCVFTSLR